jgi:signal transducing adaptor molecule
VLELSVQDRGGRKNWNEYSLASSSGAGGSSGSGSQATPQASTARPPAVSSSSSSSAAAAAAVSQQQRHSTGYVPSTESHAQTKAPLQAAPPTTGESSPQSTAAEPTSPTSSTGEVSAVTRVRALHSFEPTEPNELAFERGDIIKVVNREYKDWWRGQLRGRTGIFPVNYVVRLRPTSALTFTTHYRCSLTSWRCVGTSSGTHPG